MAASRGRPFSFGRAFRLRRSRDFQRVMRRGTRAASSCFVIVVAPSRQGSGQQAPIRLGITASRRVGGAAARNRVKRLIREWFRTHRKDLVGPADLVVIARRSATALSAGEMRAELTRLALRASRGLTA